MIPEFSAKGGWRRGALLGLLGALFLGRAAGAQWRSELWLGTAWNAPSRLTFDQLNQPELSVDAKWSTRPFDPAWVYAIRFSRWSGDAAWAFEYMHHKMYLDNPPPEVGYFRITNGVGFLLAERLWRRGGWEYGVGAGPVMSVPYSEVRGLPYDQGHGFFHSQYELVGPGVQVNLTRRLRLLPFTFGMVSLKATAAHLHTHIADGHATTWDYAVHLQYGLSLQTRSR